MSVPARNRRGGRARTITGTVLDERIGEQRRFLMRQTLKPVGGRRHTGVVEDQYAGEEVRFVLACRRGEDRLDVVAKVPGPQARPPHQAAVVAGGVRPVGRSASPTRRQPTSAPWPHAG